MKRYESSRQTGNAATGQAALEIIAGPTGCRLIGLSFTQAGPGATVLGLGRPAAAGVGPLFTAPLLNPENGEPSLTLTSLGAGASPTSPVQFMNRITTNGLVGYKSDQLIPPSGIWIPAGLTFVLFNIFATVGATHDTDIVILE